MIDAPVELARGFFVRYKDDNRPFKVRVVGNEEGLSKPQEKMKGSLQKASNRSNASVFTSSCYGLKSVRYMTLRGGPLKSTDGEATVLTVTEATDAFNLEGSEDLIVTRS